MNCGKCGHCATCGPRYVIDAHGRERLRYGCARCGYSWDTPTVEQQKAHDEHMRDLLNKYSRRDPHAG